MPKFLTQTKNKTSKAKQQLNEALDIINTLGIPLNDLTQRRLKCMAQCFLSVGGMKPDTLWKDLKSNDDDHRLR